MKQWIVYSLIFSLLAPPALLSAKAEEKSKKFRVTAHQKQVAAIHAAAQAESVKHPGRVVIYSAINHMVKQGQPVDRAFIQKVRKAEAMMTEIYKERYPGTGARGREEAFYRDLLAEVVSGTVGLAPVPGASTLQNMTKDGIKYYVDNKFDEAHSAGDNAQADFKRTVKRTADETMRTFAENVAKDPTLAVVARQEGGSDIVVGEDATDTLMRSVPEVAPAILATGILNDSIELGQEQIQKALKNGLDGVNKEIQASKEDIKAYLANQEEIRQRTEEEKQKAAFRKQVAWDTAHSSVYIISTLVGFSDPEAAHKIQTVGTATIQIGESIDKFAKTLDAFGPEKMAGMLMGCVNLVAGIGQAAQLIFSLFGGGKSETQMILEEIAALKKDVQELRKEMNERFDKIDTKLNQMMDAMEKGFAAVENHLTKMSEDVREIKGSLAALSDLLAQLETSNYYYLRAGFQQPIEETIDLCLNANPDMTLHDFEECVSRFQTFATKHATNALAVGTAEALPGRTAQGLMTPEEYFAHLGRQLTMFPSLWDGIALVTGAVEQQLGVQGVHPRGVDKSDPRRLSPMELVNAEQWSRYSQLYAEFVIEHSDMIPYAPERTRDATESILTVGAALNQTLEALAKSTTAGSTEAPGKSALQAALDEYEQMNDSIQGTLREAVQSYKHGNLAGSGMYGEAEHINLTLMNYENAELYPCDVNKKYPDNDRAPVLQPVDKAELAKALPKEVVIASQLGLGTLSVCYSDLWWRELRERVEKMNKCIPDDSKACWEVELYGKLYLTLEVRFNHNDGSKSTVLAKEFTLGDERFYARRWNFVTNQYYQDRAELTKPDPRTGLPRNISVPNLPTKPEHIGPACHQSWDWSIPGNQLIRTAITEGAWPPIRFGLSSMGTEVALDAVAAGRKKVSEQRDTRVTELRRGFLGDLLQKIRQVGSPVETVVDGIGGIRQLMLTILATAYPTALEENDELRSYFYGANAIMDKSMIITRIVEETDGKYDEQSGDSTISVSIDPDRQGNQFFTRNKGRIAGLRAVIDQIVAEGTTNQHHPMIESTYSSLNLLQAVQAMHEANPSIEAVVGEIQKSLEIYRDGVPVREAE